MRNIEEIKNDIEKVNNQIFMEKMADFMDNDTYRQLNYRLYELKEELLQAERGEQNVGKNF